MSCTKLPTTKHVKTPFARPREAGAARLSTAAVLLCLLSAGSVQAEDWPLARGNLHSTGVAASQLPSEPEIIWTFDSSGSPFEATVVVERGKIYVGDGDGTFYAIDLATGKELWSKKFNEAMFTSAAAVAGERLWVGDLAGKLRCLRTADGSLVWEQQLDAEMMAGPMLYEEQLLTTTEGGTFTSFEAATGKVNWQQKIDAPLRCMATVVDGKAMIAGCDSKLHVYNLADGKEVGSIAIDGPTGSTPAARDGKIYFGTEEGTFYAIDTTTDPMTVVWTFSDPRRRQGIRTAAAVNEKLAVYGSQGKAAYGVNLKTGEKVWDFPTRTRVESSPLVAGNVAIVATQRGKLSLVDLQSGEATWEYDAGGGFLASPVVVDGKLLIGNTDGTLTCFGAKQPTGN